MSTVMAISASPCVGDVPSTGLGIQTNSASHPFNDLTSFMRITKAIPHKDIGFTTALNDLFMCMPGLSKCHNHGKCIQDPHETDTIFLTNLKWIYWNNSTASCTLPAFHRINVRVFQVTVSRYIPLLCVVFVQKAPMHSVLVDIPQVMISLQSRRPQHICPSCWTFSKLFHGPTNFVHVMSEKAIPHNNIVLGNKIDQSVPDRTAVFKCHHDCTQVQNTCETDRVHPIAFVEVMSMPSALLLLPYASASQCSKRLHCTRAPSSEHSLAVLYASKFHNLVSKANPHKHIRSLENDIMHWAPRKNWTSHNSCLVLHLLKTLCCLA